MNRRYTLLAALAFAACGEPEPPPVSVGPVAYSSEQLLGLSPSRKATLAHLTALALAVADSATAELGGPLVGRWEDDLLLERLAAELTLEKHEVEDEVLRARYRTDPELELTVRHVLFFSERWRTADERVAAERKAERALASIREGADFAETAARLSEEPGAEGRQGLLTPGREGAWVDEFWAAASALEVGEISPVTETEYGYHILRLEGRDTVPFEEARGRVALEVADRLEDPSAVLQDWVEERAATIRVPQDALTADPDTLADDAILATWAGGELTLAGYRAWAATQPASWNGGGLGTDPDAFEASVRSLARRKVALDEADRRGLELPAAARARVERRWDEQVYQWSAALGFRTGMGAQGVAQEALAALAAAGQGADLARRELDQRAPLLRAFYEIEIAEPSS